MTLFYAYLAGAFIVAFVTAYVSGRNDYDADATVTFSLVLGATWVMCIPVLVVMLAVYAAYAAGAKRK